MFSARLARFVGTLIVVNGCVGPTPCPAPAPLAPPPPPLVVAALPGGNLRDPGEPFSVVRRSNYRIEFGPYGFEIDPFDGARILEFSMFGKSIVVPMLESPDAFGSSLWTSPQSDWSWPPPPELDRLPWLVHRDDRELVLESQPSKSFEIAVRQRISAEPIAGCILLEYEFTNRGSTTRKVAPWQNTRVRPKGLTFYPANRASYDIEYNTLVISPTDGIAWYVHDPHVVKESIKSFADGQEGWMAQLDERLLFLKIFDDVPVAEQAPGEGEVVVYVARSGKFIEMENQGAYRELLPGGSFRWTVRWALRQLPDEIEGRLGDHALVEFARKTVAEVRASK